MNCVICGNASDFHIIDTVAVQLDECFEMIESAEITWKTCRPCTRKIMEFIGDQIKRNYGSNNKS